MPDLTPKEAAEKAIKFMQNIAPLGKPDEKATAEFIISVLHCIVAGELTKAIHAHWTNKNDENVYVCSNCGHYCREFLMKKSGDIPIQGFCTECGAIMDERDDTP